MGNGSDPEASKRYAPKDGQSIVGDVVGSVQQDKVGSYTHNIKIQSGFQMNGKWHNYEHLGTGFTKSEYYLVTDSNEQDAETRPKNKAVYDVIRVW